MVGNHRPLVIDHREDDEDSTLNTQRSTLAHAHPTHLAVLHEDRADEVFRLAYPSCRGDGPLIYSAISRASRAAQQSPEPTPPRPH